MLPVASCRQWPIDVVTRIFLCVPLHIASQIVSMPSLAQMEKSKGGGGRMWLGIRRPAAPTVPPSVTASVTKETIVPITAPELPNSGGPKNQSKKDAKPVNRFGFRAKVPTKDESKPEPTRASHSTNNKSTSEAKAGAQAVGKYTLHSSHLPRPQAPQRVSSPAHVDKWAKTVANTHTASLVQTPGASNKFGFKGPSRVSNSDPMKLEIETLKESPSATKYRSPYHMQKRPNQINFGERRNKTFNMNDLERETRRVEESNRIPQAMTSSTMSESNNEEKHQRDMNSHEKRTDSIEVIADSEDLLREYDEPIDEVWGHGEAMALPEEIASLDQLESSATLMNPPLRSVLLEIEDPMFTSLAALSSKGMSSLGLLEDEKSPDLAPTSPDLSSASPPSVEPLPPPPSIMKAESGESGVSPAHETVCSSSYSSDAGRDFLIDDEIADQPALVFDASHPRMSAQISSLAGHVSRVLESLHESPRIKDRANSTSLGTLSPCDSLASDDLMADFDHSHSNIDELNDLDDSVLHMELESQSSQMMKEWNSILSAHPRLSARMESASLASKRLTTGPVDSPKANHSPLHKISRLSSQSPNDEISCDSGIRIDRNMYQSMFEEVINIKTMLLRLKRVLQESDTVDPFSHPSVKSDHLYCGLASSEAGEDTPHQLADLRRQVVLMQHQLVEKDKVIQQLEQKISKSQEPCLITKQPMKVNAATQTNRVRPLSTGPILLQTSSDNSKPYVSCSTEVLREDSHKKV